jgi:hypothetical protein
VFRRKKGVDLNARALETLVKQSQHHRKGISTEEKELQKFSSKQEVWTQKKGSRNSKFWSSS